MPRIIAGAGASGAGMTVGNGTQRAMEGQNPADIGGGDSGANAGLGLIRFRGVNGDPAFQQAWKARDAYINALTVSDRTAYDLTKQSPGLSDLMAREAVLRQKLDAARGYEEQDPIKGQLLQNLHAQYAALRPSAANPNAQPVALAAAASGSASNQASGNSGEPVPAGAGSTGSAGATPTNSEGGGDQPSSNGTSTRRDNKDDDGVKAKQNKAPSISDDQSKVTGLEGGDPDDKPKLNTTLPVSTDKLSEGADTDKLTSESESSNEPGGPPKRMNVGPSGHHVPAIRKMIGRSFEVKRSDNGRPTFHSRGSGPSVDHWRLHNAEKAFIGKRQSDFQGSDHELFDAYRRAYQGLDDIRIDVRSPDGKQVLRTNVSPVEGVNLIEAWLKQKGLHR